MYVHVLITGYNCIFDTIILLQQLTYAAHVNMICFFVICTAGFLMRAMYFSTCESINYNAWEFFYGSLSWLVGWLLGNMRTFKSQCRLKCYTLGFI